MDATADVEVSCDFDFSGFAGCYEIFQDFVRDVFVENSDIAIFKHVFFERFELDAVFVGDVIDLDGGEVGKACFWADTCEFGDSHADRVVFVCVLVFPGFDGWHFELADVVLAIVVGAFGFHRNV